MKKRTFYYTDELNQDFGTSVTKINPIPSNYQYIRRNVFFRLIAFIVYGLIVRPIAWLYVKIKFAHRFKNKKVLRKIKGGFFIFGNHTTIIGDAFMPNILTFKKKNYIITGEQTNSLTRLLPLLNMLGMIPLGDTPSMQVKMVKCIKQRIEEGSSVTVYPEAHVWPYYTGIRPFVSKSFKYVTMTSAPIICVTTCFKKRKIFKTPKIVQYVDGPFYPKEGLSNSENAQYLRDLVYDTMVMRTKQHSVYSPFEYIREDKDDLKTSKKEA